MERYLLVMAGGAIGSLLRFMTAEFISSRWPGQFPLGTFAVNVIGSLLVGVVMTILTHHGLHQNWRLFIVVGFLGGYTTFSSFEYEIYTAMRGVDYRTAAIYVTASIVFGFAALWMGSEVTERWMGRL
jgi:fluoride exporter